jgi:hypothetical protein
MYSHDSITASSNIYDDERSYQEKLESAIRYCIDSQADDFTIGQAIMKCIEFWGADIADDAADHFSELSLIEARKYCV